MLHSCQMRRSLNYIQRTLNLLLKFQLRYKSIDMLLQFHYDGTQQTSYEYKSINKGKLDNSQSYSDNTKFSQMSL